MKYLVKVFENFFVHLMQNLFLILILEGFRFLLLKLDNFSLSGAGAPGTPYGVKFGLKMVPMIFTGHVMKVYGEIESDYTNMDSPNMA